MKNKNKKFGGTIKDWQIHTLSLKQEDIDKLYPNEGLQPLIMTGTVVEDKLGRWAPGHHMRYNKMSSTIKHKQFKTGKTCTD